MCSTGGTLGLVTVILGEGQHILRGGILLRERTASEGPNPYSLGVTASDNAEAKTPGTWSVATGEPLKWPQAVAVWSTAATPVLVKVAERYNGRITYTELADAVQAQTGVRTKMLLSNWIGQVLEAVALDCRANQTVLLTALCVHQDGTVGEGYAKAASYFGVKPADPEMHAAQVRLDCYRRYAVDMPDDGGVPQLTPEEEDRRKASAPTLPPPICPIHHTVLPKSGQCDDC